LQEEADLRLELAVETLRSSRSYRHAEILAIETNHGNPITLRVRQNRRQAVKELQNQIQPRGLARYAQISADLAPIKSAIARDRLPASSRAAQITARP
jgi:hypothetical protein